MHGDLLDLVLLGVVGVFAVSGYGQGLLVGVTSIVGLVGGGLIGTQLAPAVATALGVDRSPLLGLVVVAGSATLGQVILTSLGGILRRRLVWRPARTLDSFAGAVASAAATLLVAYLFALVVFQSPYRSLASQVRRSSVIAAVGQVVPGWVPTLVSHFVRLFERGGFPQVFTGIGAAPPVVAAPDVGVGASRAVALGQQSVVKIVGDAPSCSRRLEGSGFVFARERVMTNAHVVAGVRQPTVTAAGRVYDARVVVFDPQRDVAVLVVPGLAVAALPFGGPVGTGASGVVLGYPQDGPYTAVAARVRTRESIHSPDIYGQGDGVREVYAIRASVRPGNSGGPLTDPAGNVDGVVFAAATDDPETGYVLTAAEVAGDATAGRTASAPVPTQGCD